MTTSTLPDLIPLAEASQRFSVSTRWLRDRIKANDLTRYDKNVGGSRPSFLIDPKELLALLTRPATPKPRRRQRVGRPTRYL